MNRLKWGEDTKRSYEFGVDRGVLYPDNDAGVVWNGLVSMVEAPSESEEVQCYLDGIKYYDRRSLGSFSATLEAFTYPDEFSIHDGLVSNMITRQQRKSFGLCYRTKIGNAADSNAGYKIHLVYNALASPTERAYSSIGESEEASLFSWGISTNPVLIPGASVSSHLIVDTTTAYDSTVTALEDILYGTEEIAPTLPSPNAVLDLFESNSILTVTDNGDGTFTVTGPDEAIQMLDPTTFQISWESAVMIDETSYRISSL